MPLDNDGNEVQDGTAVDPPDTAAPQGKPAGQQQPHGQQGQGKNLVIAQSTMGRIKKEERDRGAKQALTEAAKAHGFDSIEEMQAFLAGRQSAAPKPAPQGGGQGQQQQKKQTGDGGGGHRDPGPAPDGMSRRAQAAWEKERTKLVADVEAAKRTAAVNDKRYRQERQKNESLQTEMQLRESAIASGINDVDYAVRLLNRHVEGKSEEELKDFDESKFFTGLREQKPYLFGEVVKPATTGTAGGTVPPAPKPGAAAATAAKNGQIDARTMSQQEYQEHLRKRGLNPDSA